MSIANPLVITRPVVADWVNLIRQLFFTRQG